MEKYLETLLDLLSKTKVLIVLLALLLLMTVFDSDYVIWGVILTSFSFGCFLYRRSMVKNGKANIINHKIELKCISLGIDWYDVFYFILIMFCFFMFFGVIYFALCMIA